MLSRKEGGKTGLGAHLAQAGSENQKSYGQAEKEDVLWDIFFFLNRYTAVV